jgi:hypothetical protein
VSVSSTLIAPLKMDYINLKELTLFECRL